MSTIKTFFQLFRGIIIFYYFAMIGFHLYTLPPSSYSPPRTIYSIDDIAQHSNRLNNKVVAVRARSVYDVSIPIALQNFMLIEDARGRRLWVKIPLGNPLPTQHISTEFLIEIKQVFEIDNLIQIVGVLINTTPIAVDNLADN